MKHQATLRINKNAPRTAYSPNIFGGFLEHFGRQIYGGIFEPGSPLSNERGFRQDVIEVLRELKCPVVRWPGGCYVSGYHWENGVGKQRVSTDDMAWGVVEPHSFGTDEFVELCRTLGWEPYICNNAGNGTIDEMKAWVEYCNAGEGPYAQMRREGGNETPLNVRLWSIGNENWGTHEIGHKPIEEWAPFVLQAAKEMKKADPDILISAATLPTREWTLPLLEAAGEYLDFVSVHRYWLPLWQENLTPDYLTCIMHSDGPDAQLAEAVGIIEEAGYRGRVKIAFDEWNLRGWHHPGFPRKEIQDYTSPDVIDLVQARDKNLIAEQYTMADALFTASFLNACLRHCDDVAMANVAPLLNTRGPLHVHAEGVVRRTHFHTLAMYANLLGNQVVESDVQAEPLFHGDTSVPVVDAVVTQEEAKNAWAIALTNRHPTDVATCRIEILGGVLNGSYDATVLSGQSPDSYNDIAHPNRVVPEEVQVHMENGVVALPPHSLTIVQVPDVALVGGPRRRPA